MKKLFLIASLIMLCLNTPHNAFSALTADTVWEVRTGGNANNGSCFDTGASGTDYSQQNAAQVSYTDLVIGNPTTTNLTSAAFPFGADAVGNCIKITAGTGFTTGYYQVVSVASNVATMDRSVGTAGSTGGTGYMGGASNLPSTIQGAGLVAGQTIYIAGGTYIDTGWNLAVDGTFPTAPIKWIGYNTSRGDDPTGANRPVIDGNDAVGDVLTLDQQANWFYNLIIEDGTDDCVDGTVIDDNYKFVNVHFRSCTSNCFEDDEFGKLYFCEFSSCGADGYQNAGSSNSITCQFCYSHDNTSEGFAFLSTADGSFNFRFLVSESNSSDGVLIGDGSVRTDLFYHFGVLYNNTGASSDGVDHAEDGGNSELMNVSSVSNGQYAFSAKSTSTFFLFNYNNYNGHTTELNNVTAGANDTGDANPNFTDPTNADFTVTNSSSPLVGAGYPQSFLSLTGDYNLNIGLDQGDHTSCAAGAGTILNGVECRSVIIY